MAKAKHIHVVPQHGKWTVRPGGGAPTATHRTQRLTRGVRKPEGTSRSSSSTAARARSATKAATGATRIPREAER